MVDAFTIVADQPHDLACLRPHAGRFISIFKSRPEFCQSFDQFSTDVPMSYAEVDHFTDCFRRAGRGQKRRGSVGYVGKIANRIDIPQST